MNTATRVIVGVRVRVRVMIRVWTSVRVRVRVRVRIRVSFRVRFERYHTCCGSKCCGIKMSTPLSVGKCFAVPRKIKK